MIQARPIADSSSPAQQRFELELLLQEAVPDCNELEQAQPLLATHPLGVEPRHWRSLQALPLAMVEAGETGGVLDEALQRLAKLLEDNAKLQNQIKGALGYPVAVLIIAILVFLGMTIFLIPTFAGIFEDLGAELPAFTQLLVDLSELLRSPFSLFAVGFLLIAVWLFNRYYATHLGRRQVDRLILKLPLFGELIMMTATAQFCRIFSSLTRAGVPILTSLEISSQTAGNSIISDAILDSRAMVQEGVLLSSALTRQKFYQIWLSTCSQSKKKLEK